MKNPFEQKDNTALIVVLAGSALAAGTLAYLYLTESGTNTRKSIEHRLKDAAKDVASGFISVKTGISKQTVKKVADHFIK